MEDVPLDLKTKHNIFLQTFIVRDYLYITKIIPSVENEIPKVICCLPETPVLLARIPWYANLTTLVRFIGV